MTSKVKSQIVEMTPKKAAAILKNNKKNRPLSRVAVRQYAHTMKQGRWKLNGEPIIIADNDILVDGQHRLTAIVESEKTVEVVLITGVSAASFKTVDIGKKRTGADALSTHDQRLEKNRMVLAAAAKVVYFFDVHGVFDYNRDRMDNESLIDFIEKNRGLVRSVEFAQTLTTARKIAPASALAALHYLFAKKDIDLAERFFNKLNSGESMQKDDPINILRNRLFIISQEVGVIRSREVIPYLVKTWEYLRQGQKIERLRIEKDYNPKIV